MREDAYAYIHTWWQYNKIITYTYNYTFLSCNLIRTIVELGVIMVLGCTSMYSNRCRAKMGSRGGEIIRTGEKWKFRTTQKSVCSAEY